MKNFLRTITGKTISFFLCFISVCVLITSIIGAAFMIEFDFYTQDKDKAYEQIIDGKIRSDLYSGIWTSANEYTDSTIKLEKSGGIIYQILDEHNNIIGETADAVNVKDWDHTYSYGVLKDDEGNITDIYYSLNNNDNGVSYYRVNAKLDDSKESINFYSFVRKVLDRLYDLKYGIYFIGLLSLMTLISTFVILMSVAGRRPSTEELYPGPLNKIPFDILAMLFLLAFTLFVYVIDRSFGMSDIFIVVSLIIGTCIFWNIFIGLCMSLAVRIKQKNLIKGSLMYFIYKFTVKVIKVLWNQIKNIFKTIVYLISNIPLIWKTVILLVITSIYELIVIFDDNGGVFWLLGKLIMVPLIMYIAISLRNLQKGGIALANGNMSYYVDTKHMFWDFKKHGENLNDISKGMNIAIQEQMKSERMKTELITNVSHDIKTPLTSIINYTDLISKEKTNNKKINEYTEVLLRQSEKLKRLIDDLVEASKASTGNLEVNPVPCDASIFVSQASGEYLNKFKEANLTLITSLPEDELRIMADSRRMWRIFDNLMNNICKYAQPNTRVYLSLEKEDDKAVFLFKNTSKEQLNISEEELMERFTRGDESRNTDGNGLGLSIAKSMAELQNGTLKIDIDGDLFKARLEFPLI